MRVSKKRAKCQELPKNPTELENDCTFLNRETKTRTYDLQLVVPDCENPRTFPTVRIVHIFQIINIIQIVQIIRLAIPPMPLPLLRFLRRESPLCGLCVFAGTHL